MWRRAAAPPSLLSSSRVATAGPFARRRGKTGEAAEFCGGPPLPRPHARTRTWRPTLSRSAAASARTWSPDDAALSALENLPLLAFAKILPKAGPRGAAVLSCASTTLRYAASAEAHWRRFCADDIGLDAPLDPDDCPLQSFKEAYKSWFQSFRSYPLPLVKRAKSFWSSLKTWLSEYYPDALNTLAEGLTETEIILAEYYLGYQLPLPTKLLYRFCDGQILNEDLASYGIIASYSVRDHHVRCYLKADLQERPHWHETSAGVREHPNRPVRQQGGPGEGQDGDFPQEEESQVPRDLAKSNYNLEKPFLYLARKLTGWVNLLHCIW